MALSGLAGLALADAQDIVLRRIKATLDDRGLDDGDLAKGIGRSKGALSLYLSRKRKIDLPTLDAIAEFFGVETHQLLIDDPRPLRASDPTPKQAAEDAIRVIMHAANMNLRLIKPKKD